MGTAPRPPAACRTGERGFSGDGGFATTNFVVAAGFSMLFFVLLANLLVVQYGRAVVRVALDEGARHGALFGADAADCESRVERVLDGLLGEEMGSGVTFRCLRGPGGTRATASVVFGSWLPAIPDFRFEMGAVAATERR